MKRTAKQRFEQKFYVTPGCWIWTAGTARGYGVIRINGKQKKAHRVALELYSTAAPDDLVVCHKCDNRRCVNPDHLFVGTIADNNNDKVAKGRQSRTRTSGGATIPESVVDEIRADYESGLSTRAIAKKFGVTNSHVWNIGKGNKRVDRWL